MKYYRRYLGDYLKKTIRLSMIEHGAYGLLLDYYYAEETPIPLDMNEVYVICRATRPDDRAAIAKVLRLYFTKRGDGYHNVRADEEIASSQTARANGAKGGRPANPDLNPDLNPNDNPNDNPEAKRNETSSSLQPPTPNPTSHQPFQPPTKVKGRNASASRRVPQEAKTSAAEKTYREAMKSSPRYKLDPGPLNAKQRGILSRFLDRVPGDEACEIIRHYVATNRGLYVSASHCLDLLLRDCEALRIAWKTGRSVTDTAARIADQTQARGDVFMKLIDEKKRG